MQRAVHLGPLHRVCPHCILNHPHTWAFLREIAATRAMALDWLHDLGVTAEQLER